MSSKIRKACIIGVLMAFLFSLLAVLPVSAEDAMPDTTKASAVWFYHLESGRLMVEKNAQTVYAAGSTVKLLSGLLLCERLSGQLQEPIEITDEMVTGSSGYRYRLAAGEVYTVEQLLYLAVCGSYNDAYDALAYLVGGGSQANFVAAMNQRAAELGASDTLATDPTGIKDSSHTSAEDLFCIAKAAIENALYLQICSSETYDLPSKRIYNRNALVSRAADTRYYNPKCCGMTAGATQNGGASVITMAQNGNDRYLCIVLGASEDEGENGEVHSYAIANRLIDWGYAHYRYVEVLSPDTVVCPIPIVGSDMITELEVKPQQALSLYLPADVEVGEGISYSIRLMYEELQAPVQEGMPVGYVAVVYQGQIVGTAPLYTAGSAERGSVISGLTQIRNLTQSRRVRAGGIFFLLALIGWLLTEQILRLRRRHKWDKYFSSKIDMPQTLMNRNHRGDPPK